MSFHFCTISTKSHMFKVKALFESLQKIDSRAALFVLVVDGPLIQEKASIPNLNLYPLEELNSSLSIKIKKKYKYQSDRLRWSLKPVFLKFLLEIESVEKLIYIDNDVAFFSDFSFLFDALSNNNVLLTPHNYPRYPDKMQNWLEANFRVGLYNAGFVGVNKSASHMLDWWAHCCLYRCEKSAWRGLFDDQKYLDLVPIIEPNSLVLQHPGCNIAEWNRAVCHRSIDPKNGNIVINENWPVVFIHFNRTTVQSFYNGEDALLKGYFDAYISLIHKFGGNLEGERKFVISDFISWSKLKIWEFFNYLNS